MDALSALKMVTPSSVGGLPANSMQDLSGAMTKSIPPAELQQLANTLGGGLSGSAISPAQLQTLSVPNSDAPLQTIAPISSGSGANFENMLGGFISDVAQKQAAASSAVTGLLSGQNVSLHQAMISMEEANVSFQMMVEVRNRLLDGYQELMRMQI